MIEQLIHRARIAQATIDQASQERADELVRAVAWAILEPTRNRELAEMAVRDTGIGNVDDKIQKNHRKTLGLLRDLDGRKTAGVLRVDPELGITEIGRPVGVVAAITPSTNPAATPANKAINALKARNAVILAPSPKGQGCCARLVDYIQHELEKIGADPNLVQCLPAPITKQSTQMLIESVDLVVATGSQSNIRNVYRCGTPAFGVGAGNVASIVDETADLEAAAKKIVISKTFDNATSCSSENSVVVLDAVYQDFLREMHTQGAVLLSDEEKAKLQSVMWTDGHLSAAVTGKSADVIAGLAGLAVQPQTRILMVEETGAGPDFPFSGEKLSPVLTVYRATNLDAAADMVATIYHYMGAGHSVSLHTNETERAIALGSTLPVSRVIVNQPHCIATGGSFENGLPFSLSMGCGTWGKNNFSSNMNVEHYMNITRVSTPIQKPIPTVDELLSAHFEKYGR
jgi:sulfoacetaldehyde dehydrogenase